MYEYKTSTERYLANMVDCELNGAEVFVNAPTLYLQNHRYGTIVGKLIEENEEEFYIVKYDIPYDDGDLIEECGAWSLNSLKILNHDR